MLLERFNPMVIFKSLLFFAATGLGEIGGGYLVWLWLREGKSIWLSKESWPSRVLV